MFVKTDLFGGKITTVIPDGFVDLSEIRPVPENQEAYVNSRNKPSNWNDGLGSNESIIVELFESLEEQDMHKVLQTHVAELCTATDEEWVLVSDEDYGNARIGIILQKNILAACASSSVMMICLAVIRLAEVSCDVLITVNRPYLSKEEADEVRTYGLGDKPAMDTLPEYLKVCYSLLKEMCKEFKLIDKSLFV